MFMRFRGGGVGHLGSHHLDSKLKDQDHVMDCDLPGDREIGEDSDEEEGHNDNTYEDIGTQNERRTEECSGENDEDENDSDEDPDEDADVDANEDQGMPQNEIEAVESDSDSEVEDEDEEDMDDDEILSEAGFAHF